jgi:hypothetical protein
MGIAPLRMKRTRTLSYESRASQNRNVEKVNGGELDNFGDFISGRISRGDTQKLGESADQYKKTRMEDLIGLIVFLCHKKPHGAISTRPESTRKSDTGRRLVPPSSHRSIPRAWPHSRDVVRLGLSQALIRAQSVPCASFCARCFPVPHGAALFG